MELDISEALRCLGIKDPPPEKLRREMAGIAGQLTRTVQPRYAYRIFSVVHGPEPDHLAAGGRHPCGRHGAPGRRHHRRAVTAFSQP